LPSRTTADGGRGGNPSFFRERIEGGENVKRGKSELLQFEVWDLKEKRFLTGEYCILNDGKVWQVEDGRLTKSFIHGKDVEVIRYIGGKDSYGEPIYEKDLIHHTYLHYLGHGDVGEESQTVIINSLHDLPFLGNGGDVSVEVVGNTLEHPHLLAELR